MSFLTWPTSPREIPNTHYIMLHWGLLPRLTTEVVPQGLETIKTSRKGVNTSPMGVQQRTVRISSEVTNTSYSLLTRKVFSLFTVINTSGQVFIAESSSRSHRVIIIAATIIFLLLIINRYYLSSEVSIEPTLSRLGIGIVLIQVFITSQAILLVGTVQDLICIATTITCVSKLHLMISK